MPIRKENILDELRKLITSDEILSSVTESAVQLIKESDTIQKYEGIKVFVCNFLKASADIIKSVIYTDECQIIFLVPVIIFNEQFLKETEAAIRSFSLAKPLLKSPYFQSDANMYGLIDRITNNTDSYLSRLRVMTENDFEAEKAIKEQFMMTVYYFICHEIGHLLEDKQQGHYGSFLKPGSPLEENIANAVVKLEMHMRDLAKYGFTLGGGPENEKAYKEIRRNVDGLKNTIDIARQENPKWFEAEIKADEHANEIIIKLLQKYRTHDEKTADAMQYHFICGLFVAGIYSWFKDLGNFLDELDCGRTNNAQMLTLEMMKNREKYVNAASLFGDIHRFTLLRANLTIEAILKEQESWFDEDPKFRSIWYSEFLASVPGNYKELKKWRLSENLQRYYMLCILMDTAVKISFIGFSTGWLKEEDNIRGTPQLFLMQFFSMSHELDLLKRFK